MKNPNFFKKINQISALFFVSACALNNQYDNPLEVRNYGERVRNYNCSKLFGEKEYVNQNLVSLDHQIKDSSFDSFMESFISIGIHTYRGKKSLQKSKEIFDQKLQIISTNQQNKSCTINL